MRSASAHGALLLALALASCRDDSTSAPTQPVPPGLLASRHEADDPLQFSDWSAPVNLGPPVNTAFIEQAASLSRDGLSLYFHCGNCPGSIGGADLLVSPPAHNYHAWGPTLNLVSTITYTDHDH